MQVRILCATALGNHVALPPRYYSNKSQFMIMTQEEIIDTYASGTRCATFMHIQHGHRSLFQTLLITEFHSDICDYVKRCKSYGRWQKKTKTDDLSEQIRDDLSVRLQMWAMTDTVSKGGCAHKKKASRISLIHFLVHVLGAWHIRTEKSKAILSIQRVV